MRAVLFSVLTRAPPPDPLAPRRGPHAAGSLWGSRSLFPGLGLDQQAPPSACAPERTQDPRASHLAARGLRDAKTRGFIRLFLPGDHPWPSPAATTGPAT